MNSQHVTVACWNGSIQSWCYRGLLILVDVIVGVIANFLTRMTRGGRPARSRVVLLVCWFILNRLKR